MCQWMRINCKAHRRASETRRRPKGVIAETLVPWPCLMFATCSFERSHPVDLVILSGFVTIPDLKLRYNICKSIDFFFLYDFQC